ncbi:hypothetical protein PGTUg99_020251 [Puccinia graminis f. sp. tritici]|uniref:Ribosomal protein/NADH dehydrogenase domain-containing protein n=1 Tax=Puccinia graminis f. sp. tritici TaxID=56615 RepID=A0A5B0LL85_PUCGR|nr:hypothetical protein PGTUg99_020251 [Puccinia graminis f. sp. tritici]
MPSTHIIPRILRRQLITQPNPSNPESFILPIRKLLIEFNQQRQNQNGLRNFLSLSSAPESKNPSLYKLVKQFPFVEFVVRPTGGSGILKGFYLNNNRIKTIPVDGLDPNQIQKKVKHALDFLFFLYLMKWPERRSQGAPGQIDRVLEFFQLLTTQSSQFDKKRSNSYWNHQAKNSTHLPGRTRSQSRWRTPKTPLVVTTVPSTTNIIPHSPDSLKSSNKSHRLFSSIRSLLVLFVLM